MSQVPSGTEIKLCVCGPGGVGKSALTVQYIQRTFMEDYDPTVEDTYRIDVVIDDQASRLDILDTAGQEELRALSSQYMRFGHGFLLVYSIIDRATFTAVRNTHAEILESKEQTTVPMILVGNKSDLEQQRAIPTAEGKALADSLGIGFIETSALTRTNVDQAFEDLVRRIRHDRNVKAMAKPKKKGFCVLL
eukprot:c19316_g1_i5.p1 GENE.c19316_g1_i5~~c19316_g1_i5.p1  ORF type:complete len:202 (+),score=49.37 c19316_g1_i5:33-608(+)